jgi:hypothetical protein
VSLSRALRPVALALTAGALTTGALTTAAPAEAAPTAVVSHDAGTPSATAARSTGTPGDATAAISDPTPSRGDRVTVTGTGFTVDEKVTASLPSRNQGQLGSAVADEEGRVSIEVDVPTSLTDGDQEVLLTGTSGERASTGFALRPLLEDVLDRFLRWWPAERADAGDLAGTPG